MLSRQSHLCRGSESCVVNGMCFRLSQTCRWQHAYQHQHSWNCDYKPTGGPLTAPAHSCIPSMRRLGGCVSLYAFLHISVMPQLGLWQLQAVKARRGTHLNASSATCHSSGSSSSTRPAGT